MLTNAEIKHIKSLDRKKNRNSSGLFVAEGKKNIQSLLKSRIEVTHVYGIDPFMVTLPPSRKVQYKTISPSDLKKISTQKTPNEAVCICKIPVYNISDENITNEVNLVLDDLQDPGNLGTIIRTADWFGVQNIFCSKNTVDAYNTKVVNSTMGSIANVRISYVDLDHLLQNKTIPIYGALLRGTPINNIKLATPCFLVIGNEGNGISPNIQKYINHPIHIPSQGNSIAESLNASIATAILLSHFQINR